MTLWKQSSFGIHLEFIWSSSKVHLKFMSSVRVINTSSLLYLDLIESLSRNCENFILITTRQHQLFFDYTSPKLYHGFNFTLSRIHHASFFGSLKKLNLNETINQAWAWHSSSSSLFHTLPNLSENQSEYIRLVKICWIILVIFFFVASLWRQYAQSVSSIWWYFP